MSDKVKIILVGSDHAGFNLKEIIIKKLIEEGYKIKDFGTFSENSVDYPDFIHPLASAVNKGKYEKGIIICGSGQGANMTANKYSGIRSALCWNVQQAKLARLHNDGNIIALPGRFIESEEALKAIRIFFKTEFEGGRHLKRIEKIPMVI